jgi:anti-anti-sigma factor
MVDPIWTELLRAESRRPASFIGRGLRSDGEAIERSGSARELSLDGEITLRYASALADMLKDIIAGGTDSLVLDVGRVDYFDPEVMPTLALIAHDLERRGGRLRVRHPRDVIRRSFEMLGLGRLIVHDD